MAAQPTPRFAFQTNNTAKGSLVNHPTVSSLPNPYVKDKVVSDILALSELVWTLRFLIYIDDLEKLPQKNRQR